MLRRYRSLKKIVYAATILFATIVLYAGTSSKDYDQDKNREWILPTVARDTYQVSAALQEPLHRLPLGPFEDHQMPIVVESLHMQMPTFEDSKSEDNSNDGQTNDNNLTPQSTVPIATSDLNDASVSEIPSLPEIPASANAIIPSDPTNLYVPVYLAGAAMPSGEVALPVNGIPPATNDHLVNLADANLSPPLIGNSPELILQLPLIPQAALQNALLPPAPYPPTKPLPDLNKTTTEILRRLNHTRYVCETFMVPNKVDSEIYQLPQFNFSYCKIPKAGCTYWEQVISFLNQPPYQLSYLGVKMPFQISKYDIRYTSHFNLPRRDFSRDEDREDIMKTNRVLFVRHPLERLWSCYLEKFYLIDFWTTAGVSMKTSGADVKCPKSITFREFVDFTLPIFNENWAPMTELCNPCMFKPHIIGQVETLREDSYYTLKQLNLDWIFTEHDKFSREENQMLDMAIYNYQIHSIHWYSFYHKCLTQKELAAKLWDVFKKVGYLSSHAALPDNLSDYNQSTIIKELKTQFRKFPLNQVNGRAQQLKMMKRDFESLPKPIMVKILERYAMDFQLFGYSTQLAST